MNLSPNQRLEIFYAKKNSVTIRSLDFAPRKFLVRYVRDLVHHPITVADFRRRPFIHRSRYLLNVIDLDRNEYRKIYERLARESWRETPLRVGLYSGSQLVDIVSSNFGPTYRDRCELLRMLNALEKMDLGKLTVGIFSDDLELIR